MTRLLKIICPLHTRTKRDYIGRMNDDKIHCMKVARKFEKDYWDGDRRYGFGGYKYDGRWEPVAKKFIKTFKLTDKSKILDVGCGMGYLLYEIKKQLPRITVSGFDVSRYGLEHAKEEIRKYLFLHRAQDKYPYKDKEFDLVFSINALHNLPIYDLCSALGEMERVGKKKFIVVEAYRNEKELFNLTCWGLTCEAFFSNKEWIWLFKHFGYTGDYEFIYFE